MRDRDMTPVEYQDGSTEAEIEEDEREWDDQFAKSQDVLEMLADEALANLAAGRTEPLDPDRF